jgi:hypothetical protein
MNKKKRSQQLPKSEYDEKEWAWPTRADKTGKKWHKEKRLDYIKMLFSRGILDPPRQDLAEMMGVSRRQLFTDFQEVYAQGIHPTEAKNAETLLGNALKNAVIETGQILAEAGKDRKLKLQAVKALAEVSEKYVSFLEKFDIKKPGEIDNVDKEIVIRWAGEENERKTT